MKYVFIFILLPAFCFSQNQTLPYKDGKITFETIDSVKNISKSILYTNIRTWFASSFNSSNDVIQLDDKESGIIIGKGIFYIYSGGLGSAKWPCFFTVSIQYKDFKYKAVFNSFSYGDAKNTLESAYETYKSGRLKKTIEPMIIGVKSNVDSLIKSLNEVCNKSESDF